jgi:integrase
VQEPTFAEFSARWFDVHVRTNNKPSEQKTKEIILRKYLLPYFGAKKLSMITIEHVERYKAETLRKKLQPKTINNHLVVLHACLRHAVEWNVLGLMPRISMLHTIPPERDFLTVDEGASLVGAASNPFWKAMILLALRTGMRLGELCGLEWSCVNMASGVVTVRQAMVDGIVSSPKNHHHRFVPFPPSVADALRALPRNGTLVFPRPDGRPLSRAIAGYALHRICKAAGLRLVGWHTLRHSCATQLAMLRGTLLEAQRILGHSSIQMTERYTHVVPAMLHQAVSELDRAASDVPQVTWAPDGHHATTEALEDSKRTTKNASF